MSQNLDEQLAGAEHRLREVAEAIVRLLAEHLAGYPEAELQRRFVDSDIADTMSDTDIGELRQGAKQIAKLAVQRVQRELAWPGPWLLSVGPAAEGPEPPSLKQFPLIWGPVSAIDAELETLATRHGLPADNRQQPGYQPPRLFVGRAHLGQLTDHLIKIGAEISVLRAQLDTQRVADRKRQRLARWNAAA